MKNYIHQKQRKKYKKFVKINYHEIKNFLIQ